MAAKPKTRKKTTTVIESEGEGAELDTAAPALDIEGDDDVIAELLSLDGSDGVRYTVHKEPSQPGQKRAYCNVYTSEELSLDAIRSTFGGGTYRITGRDAQNHYTTSKQITILDLPKPPVPNGGGDFIARGERTNGEAMQMFMKMYEAQSQQILALMNRPLPVAPSGPTAMELVSLIKAMERKESDPIATLLKGIELGKAVGGGGETSMLDVAAQGLSALAPLIQQQANKPRAPVQPPPQQLPPAAPGTVAPPAADAPKEEKTGEQVEILKRLNWLRVSVSQLVNMAARGKDERGEFIKDPDLYAEVFMDNIPDFVTIDEIVERLSAPNGLQQLAQVVPAVAQHAEWFEQFRRACLDSVEPDDEGQPDAPGELEP